MESNIYGFIGLGLIGGSLAKNLKKIDKTCKIIAFSRTKETCTQALESGIIDEICEGPSDHRFSSCHMIFLCAPTKVNISSMYSVAGIMSKQCILTDVGSVKGPIMDASRKLGLTSQFIGAHPMAGSEKSGFFNSTDHLFENAYYILTPSNDVPEEMIEMYRALVLSLKAIPIIMNEYEHDYITAAVSHLPHVIAAALVNTVHDLDDKEENMKAIASGGFRDITRIASSSPFVWESICTENYKNISKVMDTFLNLMIEARDRMCEGDGGYLNNMFKRSRIYRESFSFSSPGPVKKEYRICCDIIDESGAIATLATILAVNSISIKNISIVHNRDYEMGVLAIEFYEEEPMKKAVELLRHHRYIVWENN